MRIAYFVHNLADPAVAKRIRMLLSLGDEAIPIGFHRDDRAIAQVAGIDAFDLGRTFDGDFAQRISMVARRCSRLGPWAELIRDCDVIAARNLEMLAIATAARRRYARRAGLVYECLDVHRLLLSRGPVGAAMRRLEATFLRRIDLLIVSSPAFLREYFEPVHGLGRRPGPSTLVVENKLLPAADERLNFTAPPSPIAPGPPWRIGWFGMIRCRRSLEVLCDLASRRPHLLRVIVGGRPSRTEFDDFDAQIGKAAGVSFGGRYEPAELAGLYAGIHFNWAIDLFEKAGNSRWLLPNRIYEGGAHNAVPIALEQTETAQWLKRFGIGVCLDSLDALEEFLLGLTPERYSALKEASRAAPRRAFVADEGDCACLLAALRKTTVRPRARFAPRNDMSAGIAEGSSSAARRRDSGFGVPPLSSDGLGAFLRRLRFFRE